MGNISLHAYNKEIEKLIENNQIDEALSHCKHILMTYPKHLDTYRLMGKAYLESQKYADAQDIMQRVLSVVPDDFLAHVGMSLIREDEGNLDGAIWHMERAFDVQPSNTAVQDELKRLIGRRDGLEPAKIRLTRGALVRMYLRGNLFTQAIAEARASLLEDPTRLDLQVVLARALNLAGLRAEALEISHELLVSLPYCYEAHRLITANSPLVLEEEVKSSHQKLIELDPYFEFITAALPTIEHIPDNSVLIEKLESLTTYDSPAQVEWNSTPENEVFPPISEDLSEYDIEIFKDSVNSEGLQHQIEGDDAPAIENSENIVPDWMSQAGWAPGEEPLISPAPFDLPEEVGEELAPAEIPDWLRSMAPISTDEVRPANEVPASEENNLPGIPDILTGTETESLADLPPMDFDTQSIDESLKTTESEEKTLDVEKTESFEGFAASDIDENTPQTEEDLPDWLRSALDENEDGKTVEAGEILDAKLPDWLHNPPSPEPSAEYAQPESSSDVAAQGEETLPDEEKFEPQEIENTTVESESIEMIAGDEEQPILTTEENSELTPEWIPEDKVIDFSTSSVEEPVVKSVNSAFPELDLSTLQPATEPDNLKEEIYTDETVVPQDESLEQLFQKDIESTADNIPAFQEPVEMLDMEEPASIDLPDWLKGVDDSPEGNLAVDSEIPSSPDALESLIIPEETPTTPGADDEILAGDEIWPIENLVTEEPGEFLTRSELKSPEEIQTSTNLQGEDVQVPVVDKESDFVKSESKQEQPVVAPVEEIDTLKEEVDIEEILLDSSTRIQQKQDLEGVIITLQNITQTHPGETQVWQTLGDAYFKNNQIQQAIDAYAKAEETLQ